MKFKGVIFDLDGTLVNSLEDIADSMNTVLINHNFPTHSLQSYKYFIGKGIKNLVREVVPESHHTDELIDEYYQSMKDTYSANYLNKTKPYEGIPELLNELSMRDLKLAVFSNKADSLTKKITAELFPGINFISVLGLTDESRRKPNPIGAIEISKKFGFPADEIVYIGDTGIDMQTAVNAGMYPVGVLWGFRDKEELLANGAKFILEHPRELTTIL